MTNIKVCGISAAQLNSDSLDGSTPNFAELQSMRFLLFLGVLAVAFVGFRFVMTMSLNATHRRLRRSTHRAEVLIPVTAHRMAELLAAPVQDTPGDPRQPYAVVETVIRAGAAGLNPARARIEVWETADGSRVVVETEASEGLIDQRTAHGAVERLITEIRAIAVRNGA